VGAALCPSPTIGCVRAAFVHEAVLELAAGADERAPGAAVTVALCGHWDHEGGCRWPHHTAVDARPGRSVRVRTLFACASEDEGQVRERISAALRTGRLTTGAGVSRWSVVRQGPEGLRPRERAHADRLVRS
jgi:hypothetical protein